MKPKHLKTIALSILVASNVFAATNTLHDKTEKTSPSVNDETYIWDVTDSILKKSKAGSLPISTATQTALNGKANSSAFASQAAFTAAWGWTPGGGVSAWSDIQALLTPGGTYVKADGTTGDPSGTITTGTGVAAAMANALDGAGGLASKASLDALPNIVFGTGITVAEDTPSAGTDTVSIDVDTAPTDGSAKPITSNAVFDALAGKQAADADLTTAAGATGAGNSKYFGTNSSGTAGFYDLPSGSGSFAFDTFPQYEDSAHSSGIAVNGTTLAVYSSTAGKWLTVGLTDSLNPAPVTYAATLTITDSSATGDTFTLNSISYDAADSPVSVTNLPTATEQITYTGSNTASCTGNVTGTGPWTINASPATVGCTITVAAVNSDNFNRADGGIGSNWSGITGENALFVSSSTLKNLPGDRGGARRTGESYNADHYSKIQILTRDTIGGAGPSVRVSSSGETYYNAAVVSTSTTLDLRKNIAGSFSIIKSFTIPTWVDGQYIKLAVSGSTLTWTIYSSDGTTVVATDSAVDTSISTGTPGVFIYNTTATLDNWTGGDI